MARPTQMRRRRVALYSHDAQGLGHIRRNLAIAATLASGGPPTEILLVTGAPGAGELRLPPGSDLLSLPALGKRVDGTYEPRTLASSLGSLIELRSRVLQAALQAFDPDVFVVDKLARGVHNELEPALTALRTMGRVRCILGLRDVLDSAPVARRDWRRQRSTEAVARYYDSVWVYGDARVFDPVAEYRLPPIVADRTTFTGYLGHGRHRPTPLHAPTRPPGPFALCLVGGGQDGIDLARSFVQADLPEGRSGVVLTGPYMPDDDRRALQSLVADRPEMTVAGFVPDTENVIASADSVISMGGYNSVCELLAQRKRTLIVPRARPRAEQLVRAERLAQRGLVDLLHPDDLSSRRISTWMAAPPSRTRTGAIDLDGLRRLPALVDAVLAPAKRASGRRSTLREVARAAV